MRNEMIWEVNAINIPLLKRKCNRCDSQRFYCSKKFRINAQKRNIDIWLIYRCVKCDSTYNMTILSRTKPESINRDLFNKFSENNLEIAWKYAFSQETAQNNNVELDFGDVDFEIMYDPSSVVDILNSDSEILSFKIKYPVDFRLKSATIIRKCLNLSSNQLNHVINAQAISIRGKHLQKRYKTRNGDVIRVNREMLKNMYPIFSTESLKRGMQTQCSS